MDFRFHWSFRVFNTIILGFIFANLVFLNYWIFVEKSKEKAAVIVNTSVSEKKTEKNTSCSDECVKNIYQSIYEATQSARKNSRTSQNQNGVSAFSDKESIISFGSGSTTSEDWTDVSGLQVQIDTSKYGKIKKVVFEAYIRIPTGNERAYARLYNVTDKHPVWFSEVSLEGGTPQLLTSLPITLDSGPKTYQIQMKTSLKYLAFLDSSRIRILSY